MAEILDILSSMFGGQQRNVGPAYAPQPNSDIPVPQPNPMRSQGPVTRGGNIGEVIGDAFSGMGNVDPTASAISAFGQGYSGSQASRKSRVDEEERKAAAAAAQTREDHQQKFENELKRSDARRKEISSQFSNLRDAAYIEKLQSDAAKNGIRPEDYAKLEQRMTDYREVLAGKYGELFVDGEDADGTERSRSDMFTIIDAMVEEERQRQIKQMQSFGTGTSEGKQGTEQNPFQPYTEAQLSTLPVGAVYRNPADGQLYRKR